MQVENYHCARKPHTSANPPELSRYGVVEKALLAGGQRHPPLPPLDRGVKKVDAPASGRYEKKRRPPPARGLAFSYQPPGRGGFAFSCPPDKGGLVLWGFPFRGLPFPSHGLFQQPPHEIFGRGCSRVMTSTMAGLPAESAASNAASRSAGVSTRTPNASNERAISAKLGLLKSQP